MTARMRLHGVGQSIGGWKSPWLPWLSVSRLYLYHKSNDQYTTEKHDYAFICAVSGGLLHMKTSVWLNSGWPSCGKCSFGCTIWVLLNLTSNSVASGWLVATVDGELWGGPEVAWAVQQLGLCYQAHILCTIYIVLTNDSPSRTNPSSWDASQLRWVGSFALLQLGTHVPFWTT